MANSHNAYSRYLLTAGFIIIILEEKKKTKIILFSSAARNMRREDVPVWPKNFRKFNLFTFVANATIFCTHLKCHQTKAHNLMFWTMFRTDFCVRRKKKKNTTLDQWALPLFPYHVRRRCKSFVSNFVALDKRISMRYHKVSRFCLTQNDIFRMEQSKINFTEKTINQNSLDV